MHFWHTQPVFHIYNLKYWIKPPGFINMTPPPLNKFVNLSKNKLIVVSASASASEAVAVAVAAPASEAVAVAAPASASAAAVAVAAPASASAAAAVAAQNNQISQLCKFISDYYIIHESATYKPSEQDIMAYLECTNQPSYFNIYQDSEQELVGVTSARLLNVSLKKQNFGVYYVDNLCVKPGYRRKGIAPEMIQTFYYNVARTNKKVNAYLFKREGQLNAIVPLVYYDTHVFDLANYRGETLLHASMNLIEIGVSQLNIFVAFIKEQTPNFDCVILPDLSNVLNLLKLGKLKIYGILSGGELIAAYVFRCLELSYADKKAIECIAIIVRPKHNEILIAGFNMCWPKLQTLTQCAIVFIEETAQSKPVIAALALNPTAVFSFKSPTAFFLYNYAAYTVKNTKTLLIY